MEKKRLIELGEFLNKSVFDGSLKTNDAFAEGIILFTQESVALLKEHEENCEKCVYKQYSEKEIEQNHNLNKLWKPKD